MANELFAIEVLRTNGTQVRLFPEGKSEVTDETTARQRFVAVLASFKEGNGIWDQPATSAQVLFLVGVTAEVVHVEAPEGQTRTTLKELSRREVEVRRRHWKWGSKAPARSRRVVKEAA